MKYFYIKNRLVKNFVLPVLVMALSTVLFMICYQYLPATDWPFSLDKIAVLILMFTALLLLVKFCWPVIFLGVAFIALWFGNSWYNSNYNFASFYKDGQFVLNDLTGSKNKNFVYTGYGSLYNDKVILKAIDYKSPVVRDFAVTACNTFFKKEQLQARTNETRLLIQCMAVFKKINHEWNYVSDPAQEEYFAKASESVWLLAGDCDDYSVLMAGAIKSIGGKVRLLCVKGHIYPEVFVGTQDNLKSIGSLIQNKLFVAESKDKKLNYHNDDKGNVWLNLDYTTYYPGGSFMGNSVMEYIYP